MSGGAGRGAGTRGLSERGTAAAEHNTPRDPQHGPNQRGEGGRRDGEEKAKKKGLASKKMSPRSAHQLLTKCSLFCWLPQGRLCCSIFDSRIHFPTMALMYFQILLYLKVKFPLANICLKQFL